MEFEEIIIENFCTIEHVKLKLNQPGLILITGVNKDAPTGFESNGAGKSLLFDAICWVLWDRTARDLSGDDVVRRRHGKDCVVKLKMREGKNTYMVSRHRKDSRIDKPNDLRLFVNGVEKTKKMKQLQEVINQIIGFDFTTFCAMMPGAGINVATLTDTGIKELLEKLLQTEQLSSAYSQARERLRELDGDITKHAANKQICLTSLRVLETEVAQLRGLEKSFEQNKATTETNVSVRIDSLVQDIANCQTEMDKVPGLIQEAEVLKNEITALNKQIVAIETPARLRIKQLKDDLLHHQLLVDVNKDGVRGCDARADRLSKLEGACPTCEAAITVEHLSKALALVQTDKLGYLGKQREAEKTVKTLERDVQYQITTTANELASLQGLVQMKTMAITALNNAANEATRFTQTQIRYKNDLEREQKALATVRAETHNFGEIFKTKAEQTFSILSRLAEVLKLDKIAQVEANLCRFWVEGFSPAGLRSYMLDYVTPVLNDRAAYYARVLTGNEMKVSFTTKTLQKKGDIKDKFNIIVEYKHGGDVYRGTSKGEKARADLVIAMALGDLATFRTAKQLPWRFLDEPFESIDDAGNQAVMALLTDQKDRFKTVFVVTHKPAFKQLFTQKIVMTKENGVSTLTKDFQ